MDKLRLDAPVFVGLVNPRALLIFAGFVVFLVLVIVYVRWRLMN